MSDNDSMIAALRAELDACQDKLNRLPVDWDTDSQAQVDALAACQADIKRLRDALTMTVGQLQAILKP